MVAPEKEARKEEGAPEMDVNLSLVLDATAVNVRTVSARSTRSAAIPSGMKRALQNAQRTVTDVEPGQRKEGVLLAVPMAALQAMDLGATDALVRAVSASRIPTAATPSGMTSASISVPMIAASVEMEVERAHPTDARLPQARVAEDVNVKTASVASIASAATTHGMTYVFSNARKIVDSIVRAAA